MSEDIKEIKVTKKPGFAINFDGTYASAYKIINKYVSIFGKYNMSFAIGSNSNFIGDLEKYELVMHIEKQFGSDEGLDLKTGDWLVFFGADINVYNDADFKATFEEQESK